VIRLRVSGGHGDRPPMGEHSARRREETERTMRRMKRDVFVWVGWLLMGGMCCGQTTNVIYWDDFEQFPSGTVLTSTNYTPSVGENAQIQVNAGSPQVIASNLDGSVWAVFDSPAGSNGGEYRARPALVPSSNQVVTISWLLRIEEVKPTAAVPNGFFAALPTVSGATKSVIVFCDSGSLLAITNHEPPAAVNLGVWSNWAGSVMTNELKVDYLSRTFTFSLNGTVLTQLPLWVGFTNRLSEIGLLAQEDFDGAQGNRFALDDVKIIAAPEAEAPWIFEVVSLERDGVLRWRSNRTNIYWGIQYTSTLPGYWEPAPSTSWWNVFSAMLTNSVTLPPSVFELPSLFLRVVGSTLPLTNELYDVVSNGIPEFVETNYIELDKIARISRFRSGAGHDYSDDFESCRSMKHYYLIDPAFTNSPVRVFSPVAGVVTELQSEESGGTQIRIKSTEFPAFRFYLFHVDATNTLRAGSSVTAGQVLGTHFHGGGTIAASDIAVWVNTPSGRRLVSYFDVMTDSLFHTYESRGVNARSDMVISREQRDADPLTCDGERFLTEGNLPNYVDLEPVPSPPGSAPATSRSTRNISKSLKPRPIKTTTQRSR